MQEKTAKDILKQLTRIADAMEKRNAREDMIEKRRLKIEKLEEKKLRMHLRDSLDEDKIIKTRPNLEQH